MKIEREVAEAVIAKLQQVRLDSGGRLPHGELTRAAAFAQVPKSTLSRWLNEGLPPPTRAMRRFSLLDDADGRAVLYEVNKSRAAAHRRLVIERGVGEVPSERTLQRAFRRDLTLSEQHAVERGDQGWRSHRPAERYEPEYRNQHWQSDHTQLEIYVKPYGKNRRASRPWLTAFVDCYSRAIMGYCVSLQPNQGHVLAGLGSSVSLREEHGPFCGVPAWLTTDRGMEFVADAVIEAVVMMRITAMPTLPRHPQHNGKVERLHQSVAAMFLADLPGFTDGALDLRKQPMAGAFVLPLDAFLRSLARWVDYYNVERPHSALGGRTPGQAFVDDPTPISMPPQAVLRRFLLKGGSRVVTREVLTYEDREYISDAFPHLEGRRLEIRADPNDPRYLEIYDEGVWISTAVSKKEATPAERDAWVAANEAVAERHRVDRSAARRRSRRRYKAMVDDSPAVETTTVPEATPADAADRRRVARDRALRRLK